MPHKNRVTSDPEILAGKPVIRGTRISVDLILEYLARNPNFEEFFLDYPDLTMADVQAAFSYARDVLDGQATVPEPKRSGKDRAVHQSA